MPKERILIVDDEQDVVDLLRYNLEQAEYEIIVALDGEQAIKAVQRHSPDAVILDIMLPELSGWDVCKILRESSEGKSLPIIMVTALSDEESRIKGLSLGADDYLVKPFSLKELQLKVRKCLDQRQTMKSLIAKELEHDTSLRYLVHELKNSLSIIGNFSALALKKEENAQRYLRSISAASAHAENLLNDTSLLTRLEQDDFSLPIAPVNIADLAEEVADLFRDEARSRSIQIIITNTTRLPVKGYRTAVKQVLVNLVSNAVKYNRQGGNVWISFNNRGPSLHVSIRDEGCGVPREELSRIFDKFYRAAGSEHKKGAGLGLFIVKRLIKAMGGEVAISSEMGVGSTFTVSFQHYVSVGCNRSVQVSDKLSRTE